MFMLLQFTVIFLKCLVTPIVWIGFITSLLLFLLQPNFALAQSPPSGQPSSFRVNFLDSNGDTGFVRYANNICTIRSQGPNQSFTSSLNECFSFVSFQDDLQVHAPLTVFLSKLTIFSILILILHIIYSAIPGRIFGVD